MTINDRLEKIKQRKEENSNIIHQAQLVMEQAGAEIIRLDNECVRLKKKIVDLEIYRANCREKLIELGENPDTLDREGF